MDLSRIREEELLPDPLGDRKINSVPRMPNKRLELDRIFCNDKGKWSELPDDELIRIY